MQAAVLFTLGNTFAGKNRKKAAGFLERAYDLFVALPDPQRPDIRALGAEILSMTAAVSPRHVENSLPQDNEFRAIALLALSQYYSRNHRFEIASNLCSQIEQEPEVYQASTTVLGALPKSDTDTPNQLLMHAITVFQNTRNPQMTTGTPDDLASLLVRYQDRFRPQLIRLALDALIDQAKTNPSQFRTVIAKGRDSTVVFRSFAEFRLFQLLPIFERLDPSKAEELKRGSLQAGSLLAHFPEGQRSLDSSFNDSAGDGGAKTTYRIVRSQGETGNTLQQNASQRLADDVVSSAEKNWRPAISQTDFLPTRERLRALVGIARLFESSNPDRAATALERMFKSIKGVQSEGELWIYFVDAAMIFKNLSDTDSAIRALEQASQLTVLVYKTDADPEDPNHVVKLFWPSAQAWRDIVEATLKVSPNSLNHILADISDDEIRVFAEVTAASAALNVPAWRGTSPMVRKKHSSPIGE